MRINLGNLDHDLEESISGADPYCSTCGDDIPLDVYQLGPGRYLVGRYCLN